MKTLVAYSCLALLLIGLPRSLAQTDTNPTPESVLFERAGHAYDRGDYTEALRQYQELFNRGYYTVETLYNAANASFRQGSVGNAVLLYRRAWYMNPRDADVQANMQLALQRTGAIQPHISFIDHAARELSHREWSNALRLAYWTLLATLAIMVLFPPSRRFFKPVALASGFVAMISLGGWYYWYRWQLSGEAVVVSPKQTALYEPREKATPFFAVAEGSIVYIEEAFDSWIKIRSGQNAGWLPKTAASPVYPWINRTE